MSWTGSLVISEELESGVIRIIKVITEVKEVLRLHGDLGRKAASRVSRLSKCRNGIAHPDPSLETDIIELLGVYWVRPEGRAAWLGWPSAGGCWTASWPGAVTPPAPARTYWGETPQLWRLWQEILLHQVQNILK